MTPISTPTRTVTRKLDQSTDPLIINPPTIVNTIPKSKPLYNEMKKFNFVSVFIKNHLSNLDIRSSCIAITSKKLTLKRSTLALVVQAILLQY